MILHVLKHPDPKTLATCSEVADGTPAPNGWEAMTVSEFSAWEAAEIAAGWAPPPPPTQPAPVPAIVTRRKLFLWLNAQGITRASIRGQLELIENAQAREAALIEFDEAIEFSRDHTLVQQLAVMLGFNSEGIDNAFREASVL